MNFSRFFLIGLGGLVILVLGGCGGSSSSSSSPSYDSNSYDSPSLPPVVEDIFDIVGLFSNHPAIKFLSFLKIINDVVNVANAPTTHYNDYSKTVSFNTPNGYTGQVGTNIEQDVIAFTAPNSGQVDFSPAVFQASHQLASNQQVNNLDYKIQEDYRECTDDLLNNSTIDHNNFSQELEFRINCLTNKGYSENDRAYMQIKHNLTI